MAFAGSSSSTPCVKVGFFPPVLSRLRGRLQRGKQAVKTFSAACWGAAILSACRLLQPTAGACGEAAMESATSAVESRRAWTIAISLFISLFFLWGGGYNTAPIFLAALLKAFGWSHGRVSWITGGLSLAIGVSAPIAGWLLDRVEARFVMGSGALVAVAGLL